MRLRLTRLEDRCTPSLNFLGSEFQVNTSALSLGNQWFPKVDMGADGDFLVSFAGYGGDSPSDYGIFVRQYDTTGFPTGAAVRVATVDGLFSTDSDVALRPDASFMAVWANVEPTLPQHYPLAARIYSSTFTPLTPEIVIETTGAVTAPAVGVDAAGVFSVAWCQDGAVWSRRYDGVGAALGDKVRLSSPAETIVSDTRIAVAPGGGAVVVWTSLDIPLNITKTMARRLKVDGTTDGEAFNAFGDALNHNNPSITMDAAGNFAIAAGPALTPALRRFAANGTVLSTTTTDLYDFPTIAMSAGGALVMAGSTPDFGEIAAKREGVAGPGQLVNQWLSGQQARPAIAMNAAGDGVIVWQSYGQDLSEWGVAGRRFAGAAPAVTSHVVNGGDVQRSRIDSVQINFSRPVLVNVAGFTVTGPYGDLALGTQFTVDQDHALDELNPYVMLYFPLGVPTGLYTVTVAASGAIVDLVGQQLTAPALLPFHRLLGDFNGNRAVDGQDFNYFRLNYGIIGISLADLDNDNDVDAADFNLFRLVYGTTI